MYCIYNIHITVVHNIAVNMIDLNIYTIYIYKNTDCVDQSAVLVVIVSITTVQKVTIICLIAIKNNTQKSVPH